MGHRFSKSISSINHQQQRSSSSTKSSSSTLLHANSRNQINDIPPSSNQENLNNQISSTIISSGQNLRLESATLTVPAQVVASGSVADSIPRRFIIKIQLTKMEPGDSNDDSTTLSTTLAVDSNNSNDDSNSIITKTATTTAAATATVIENVDNNLNITNPVLNLTFTKNIPCDGSGPSISTSTITSEQHQIIIENGNETFQLNNLNANTTSATINSNFVDNFALSSPSSSSSSSPSSSQIVATTSNAQLFMDTEGNNNFAGKLNNLDLPTKSGGFTHSNIIISNSTHNHNSNGSNNNFIKNSINCNSDNDVSNLNNDPNSPIPTTSSNSICNNENEECNAGEGESGLTMCNAGKDDKKTHCCQSRKKPSSSTSSAYPTKWRCCKCSCRDSTLKLSNTNSTITANTSNKNSTEKSTLSSTKPNCASKLHRVPEVKQRTNLLPHSLIKALATSSNAQQFMQHPANTFSIFRYQQQQQQQQQQQPIPLSITQVAIPSSSSQQQPQSIPLPVAQVSITSTSSQQQQQPQNRNASISVPRSDHLTMWEPVVPLTPFIEHHHHHHHHHHHIQAVAQCAGGPHNLFVVSVNPHPTPSTSSSAAPQQQQNNLSVGSSSGSGLSPMEIEPALANVLSPQTPWHHIMCGPSNFGTVVHSQVDYIHCLVPDLEKITNSSFYWGKMDRYEAERLLEGKPEGTFLLRDSAQEEYLFSVTFRKYGRSLHARIEQFNHKFSFDGHDPGVFTANTVTGLLEHYKDPSCVMFFEPMLTIPLHRNFTFSLQQLCRATIVSHVTYDGINELLLPNSLKSYLKEYHYKLRVRVKPFDEPFYTCS